MDESVRIGDDVIAYDKTYEMGFDGEMGSLVSLDAEGHLDDRAVELFMASAVAEAFECEEGPLAMGFDVEYLWRSTHPYDDGDFDPEEIGERWTFSYTGDEREGAVPVTRFQVNSTWTLPALSEDGDRMFRNRRTGEFDVEGVDYFPIVCVNHPDEVAVSGVHESQVIDPPRVIDRYVYFCRPCSERFHARLTEARKRALQ